jgi:hypothetical protein
MEGYHTHKFAAKMIYMYCEHDQQLNFNFVHNFKRKQKVEGNKQQDFNSNIVHTTQTLCFLC